MALRTESSIGSEPGVAMELRELQRTVSGRTVLFLSPTPALSPLLQAQGIPHMRELASKFGLRFILFTIEGTAACDRPDQQEAKELRKKLASWSIEWLSMRNGRMPLLPNSTSDVLRGIPRVARLLRSKCVELVHCRSYVPAFIMLALKPFLRVPWIFDVRGFYPDELVRESQWDAHSAAYRVSLWLEHKSFDYAAATVVVTDRQRRLLLQKWPHSDHRRIAVIRNCADIARFAPNPGLRQAIRERLGITREPILVWTASTIRSVHAPSEVLAFARVCRDLLGSRLLILTRTAYADGMVRAAGLSAGEYDIIPARSEEVPAYLNASDAGIAFTSPGHEDVGIKFAEYLAAGLSVVANGMDAEWGRLLRHRQCGVVVEEFSSSAFQRAARSLSLLLAESGVRDRCRTLALSQYSLQSAVDAYASLYSRLLEPRR